MTKIAALTSFNDETSEQVLNKCGGNKSAAIRYLHSQGMKKADIARFLDVIYQQVRNTLLRPLKKEINKVEETNNEDQE